MILPVFSPCNCKSHYGNCYRNVSHLFFKRLLLSEAILGTVLLLSLLLWVPPISFNSRINEKNCVFSLPLDLIRAPTKT